MLNSIIHARAEREAVALANQRAVSKAQIGRELDINPNMITRWQREMTASGSKAFLVKNLALGKSGDQLAAVEAEVKEMILSHVANPEDSASNAFL